MLNKAVHLPIPRLAPQGSGQALIHAVPPDGHALASWICQGLPRATLSGLPKPSPCCPLSVPASCNSLLAVLLQRIASCPHLPLLTVQELEGIDPRAVSAAHIHYMQLNRDKLAEIKQGPVQKSMGSGPQDQKGKHIFTN